MTSFRIALESQSQSLESRMQGGPVLEGGELSVLEDLLPFIRRRLIQNIVVEMTPGWWPQIDATALLVEMEEFGMWAYTQNAPDTRVPAIKLTHFIRTRRPRPQQNVWFRRF